VAGDLAEELDVIVRDILKKAAARAEAN
jgi:hypothetical protein